MKVFIFHANAGHGHKKVAEVIEQAFRREDPAKFQVSVFDALDFTPGFFKKIYPAIYYYAVKYFPGVWGFFYELLDLPLVYHILRPLRSLHNRIMGSKLLAYIAGEQPDAVICTHFLSAELIASAKRRRAADTMLFTVITDFYPHSFWVNEGTDRYRVMSEEGAADLRKRGVPDSLIDAGGIPVGSMFCPKNRRREVLTRHALNPNTMTILLTSGSFGLGPQEAVLDALAPFKDNLQCLAVCGNNQPLFERLKARTFPYPVRVFGFVDFMADLMDASDLMIAKPGGATTCESLSIGIPLVTMEPIPGQESRNARLLKIRRTGYEIHKPEDIGPIIQQIRTDPNELTKKRENIKQLAKPEAAQALIRMVLEIAADGHQK